MWFWLVVKFYLQNHEKTNLHKKSPQFIQNHAALFCKRTALKRVQFLCSLLIFVHGFQLQLNVLQKETQAPFTLQVTRSDKVTRSHSFQWGAGDFRRQARQRPLATGWGVSSDVTKFRIPQLYANEERHSGATANRKEDGRAHVIVLLSAVDKHTQWKKVGSVSHSFLFVCTDLIYIIFRLLPPKYLYLAARNLIRCQGNQ